MDLIPLAGLKSSEGAAVGGSATFYAALFAVALFEAADKDGRDHLLVASAIGACLCIAAYFTSQPFLSKLALIPLALIVGVVLFRVLRRIWRARSPRWPATAQLKARPKYVFLSVALVLIAAIGALIGAVVFGGDTTVRASVRPSGRYRVSGTCVNGSCYVNECPTPGVCGSANEGELKEETAVDIVCQTRGGVAEAPDGRHSRIWDRLSSTLYVSDLFVSGTADAHFAAGLPRCAGA